MVIDFQVVVVAFFFFFFLSFFFVSFCLFVFSFFSNHRTCQVRTRLAPSLYSPGFGR